jgi:hypothetical protein
VVIKKLPTVSPSTSLVVDFMEKVIFTLFLLRAVVLVSVLDVKSYKAYNASVKCVFS